MSKNPDAPITRLPNLAFISDEGSTLKALYTPNLSPAEIAAMPVTEELKGAIVFDHLTEELLTFTAAGFWLPILTAESDITVDQITATTGDFDVINCNTLNSVTINNTGAINTFTLTASGIIEGSAVEAGALFAENSITTSSIGNVTTPTLFINDVAFIENGVIQGALAGGTGNNDDSPITATLGAGAGTGGSYIIKGSLTSGLISITTGTSPSAASVIATFTIPSLYANYFSGTYGVTFTAASTTTAPIAVYATVSDNLFLIGTSSTLSASTTYLWNYHVIGTLLN